MTTVADLVLRADPAMIVVTTVAGDTRAGCLVGFHSQSGIEPDTYTVWLSKANHTYEVARRAEHFAVHLLRSDQVAVARNFGTRCGATVDKFADIGWSPGPGGLPLLDECPDRLVGTRRSLTDAVTNHACLVLDAVEVTVGSDPFDPLCLSQVVDLEAAHDPSEF